ncbi:hypothetical protein [Aquabacterium sp.]|uniref:hypothetical protein n=1 Tax=Aquabacterium sp. TaxID=1872578 RepID=UPI0040377964
MKYLSAICPLLASVFLTGCSVSASVVAVLHDDLFVGKAVGYMDRTGTLDLQSALDPQLRCVGQFYYTGSSSGQASVQCNDGATGTMSFNALGMASGYGYGNTSRGPASFTFGLDTEDAEKYLKLPKGKKIAPTPKGPQLIDL